VNSDPASGAAVASELVDAIKDWKLEELGLATATRSTLPSSFWNRIAEELTPLSVQRVKAGYKGSVPLPQLKRIVLGFSSAEVFEPPVDGVILTNLVKARRALSQGASATQGSAAANREVAVTKLMDPNLSFRPAGSCAQIESLVVNIPMTDKTSAIWLKENVSEFKMQWSQEDLSDFEPEWRKWVRFMLEPQEE